MNSIEQRFTKANIVVNNISAPIVKAHILNFGVKQEFIDKCVEKKDEVNNLISNHNSKKQEDSIAYDNFMQEQERCNKKYLSVQKMVKLCTRHDDNISSRIVTSIIPYSPANKWFSRVGNFYIKIASEPTVMEYLKMFNITPEVLASYSEELMNARRSRVLAIEKRGKAEDFADKKNRAIAELEDMCYELVTLARIALQDSPQLLEQLGVVIK
ncbi:MAG: hypothetical protein N4A72_06880 [Bacteroidales bacterium]|jgi:hypothetical protein|nr:hypothetical protein [Bacteroidales bacterium]